MHRRSPARHATVARPRAARRTRRSGPSNLLAASRIRPFAPTVSPTTWGSQTRVARSPARNSPNACIRCASATGSARPASSLSARPPGNAPARAVGRLKHRYVPRSRHEDGQRPGVGRPASRRALAGRDGPPADRPHAALSDCPAPTSVANGHLMHRGRRGQARRAQGSARAGSARAGAASAAP